MPIELLMLLKWYHWVYAVIIALAITGGIFLYAHYYQGEQHGITHQQRRAISE